MEALTLIQTGKIQRFPLILFGSGYWSDLLAFFREDMLGQSFRERQRSRDES